MIWNLAAVRRPLQATRTTPTKSSGLHELATRQNPFMSRCTRYWLTNPKMRLERLQMAWAMSRTFPLCRNKVAAPDYLISSYVPHAPLGAEAVHTKKQLGGESRRGAEIFFRPNRPKKSRGSDHHGPWQRGYAPCLEIVAQNGRQHGYALPCS